MKKVMLSFDVEEFDFPRERKVEISLDEGVKVSSEGLLKILKVCKENKVKATFFCTGNFASKRPDLIREILEDGHEVACHGVDHFEPKKSDVHESKKIVEKVAKVKVNGYRQPRMQEIDYKELKRCGYLYDSSVNPAFIPGRYNHLNVPKGPFEREGIVEIPTSVATFMRVPLFWLALHLFPKKMYFKMARMAMKREGFFTTYFHPWEFADLSKYKVVPGYIKKNSGDKLAKRLGDLIRDLKKLGAEFVTYSDYVKTCYNSINEGN